MNWVLLSLCLVGTKVEGIFSFNALCWLKLTSYRMDFPFMSAAIQKRSFITNYKHIYIVNDIKSPKSCPKNNFQSGSWCKLGFPNNSLKMTWLNFHTFQYFIIIQKTLKAHRSFSTETINSIKKQGKPQVVYPLFTLQNSQNDLYKPRKLT